MLLSIDRVLQLLGEGKSIDKIAQMAECNSEEVVELIENARNLLLKYEKSASRKKVILKKKDKNVNLGEDVSDLELERDIYSGAEFAAIPIQSSLIMYVAGEQSEGHTAMGIIIKDKDGKQVGKVSLLLNVYDDFAAGLAAIIKSLKIAKYFSTCELKIRTHMEDCVRYIEGTKKNQEKYEKYAGQLKQINDLISQLEGVSFENIPPAQNDKAIYFANKACTR